MPVVCFAELVQTGFLSCFTVLYLTPYYYIKMKIPPKWVGISSSFPEPPVTNAHQIKVWYDQYACPWPESWRIGAIHAHCYQKSSGNSAVIKKIILSDQTFLNPVWRGHSLILTPRSWIWPQILLEMAIYAYKSNLSSFWIIKMTFFHMAFSRKKFGDFEIL